MSDPKLAVSVITGAVATAAAFRRDLDALFAGHRSVVSQIKDEEERLGQIDKSLREMRGDEESCAAARHALENDRRVALQRLKRLTAEFSRQREDPNYDLSFIQRLFLLFRPESKRAETIHWLGCAFMALGIISILCWVCLADPKLYNREKIEEFIADFAVLGCYGALLFRTWALAERRWKHHYNCKSSVLHALFIIKGPAEAGVRWAQACFWICLYWVIESLEDFVQDVFSGEDVRVSIAVLKFGPPLVVALFCRYWAVAELRHARTQSVFRWQLSAFLRPGWGALAIITGIIVVDGFIALLVRYPSFFNKLELEHQIALVLQLLILCIACRWRMALAPRRAVPVAQRPMPVRAQSAAA